MSFDSHLVALHVVVTVIMSRRFGRRVSQAAELRIWKFLAPELGNTLLEKKS
jgi:hypothetical protein